MSLGAKQTGTDQRPPSRRLFGKGDHGLQLFQRNDRITHRQCQPRFGQGGLAGDFIARFCVRTQGCLQRRQPCHQLTGATIFALQYQHTDLLGQHEGQQPVQAQHMKMCALGFEEAQGRLRRLALQGDARTADSGAPHHIGHG
ncbi:hypothetical protein D3C73_991370 [compost metagenome]